MNDTITDFINEVQVNPQHYIKNKLIFIVNIINQEHSVLYEV